MDYIRIKAYVCRYKGKDRRLKEQFINSINDDDMMTNKKVVTCSLKIIEITSGQVQPV